MLPLEDDFEPLFDPDFDPEEWPDLEPEPEPEPDPDPELDFDFFLEEGLKKLIVERVRMQAPLWALAVNATRPCALYHDLGISLSLKRG